MNESIEQLAEISSAIYSYLVPLSGVSETEARDGLTYITRKLIEAINQAREEDKLAYWNGLAAENESLRSQLSQLKAEAVEQAALVERLRTSLDFIAVDDCTFHMKDLYKDCGAYIESCKGLPEDDPSSGISWTEACNACHAKHSLSQSPPTGFGVRMLELGRAGYAHAKSEDQGLYGKTGMIPTAIRLIKAAAAITKEDQDWISPSE